MQALPPREEWPCCNGATKTDWKNLAGTQAKVQGPQKGARQLKSRKPLRKTQGQASFLDRRVRNMENRRGPLNRRIRRYSILQQLNFGDTSIAWSSYWPQKHIVQTDLFSLAHPASLATYVGSFSCSSARPLVVSHRSVDSLIHLGWFKRGWSMYPDVIQKWW